MLVDLLLVRFCLIFLFVPCASLLLHVNYTVSYRTASCFHVIFSVT